MACITEEHAEFIWITLIINPRVWWERITEREFQDSVILETPRMPREYRRGVFRIIFENLEELPGKPPCCQIQVNSQAWAHLISGECKSQFEHSIIKHILGFVSKHQILLVLWLLSLCLRRFFCPLRWWRVWLVPLLLSICPRLWGTLSPFDDFHNYLCAVCLLASLN